MGDVSKLVRYEGASWYEYTNITGERRRVRAELSAKVSDRVDYDPAVIVSQLLGDVNRLFVSTGVVMPIDVSYPYNVF